MILSSADQNTYPKFAHYVRYDFPKLIRIPKIMANLKKYGNISLPEFQAAMIWGAAPKILIRDLNHGQCGVPEAYGCFRKTQPQSLEIHTKVVADFEASSATSTDKDSKGETVYVAAATLLHELCHWGNYNNSPRFVEPHDMGDAFELATYGKPIYLYGDTSLLVSIATVAG